MSTTRFNLMRASATSSITKISFLFLFFVFSVSNLNAQSIRINEVVSSNSEHNDEDGDSPDWLELHNYGTENVTINNWGLTDDEEDLTQWVFPNITLAPNQYLLIWASDKDRSDPASALHTNFKISSSSETLLLTDASGAIVDQITAKNLIPDTSLGISKNSGNLVVYLETTPGGENSNTEYKGNVQSEVIFSHEGGLSSGSISLSLSGNIAGEEIRYTIGGNTPNETSTLYTGPIPINANTTVRAQIFAQNYIPSPVYTESYIINANHEIDVILLTTDPANLFDDETGIYVLGTDGDPIYPNRGANFWEDWERPIHFAFYEKGKGKAIEFNAGVKIFGGATRTFPQKSLSLFARSRYGDSEFEHSFFDELSYDKFESLVLRNSGNDWLRSSMKDIMASSLMRGSGLDFQEHTPVATYINGEYWGRYNLREKVNEHMLASKHDVDADDITLLEFDGRVIEGTNTEYKKLLDYVSTTDLSQDSNFEYVAQEVDLADYALYQATQIFYNNTDWPGNNIKYWKHSEGKWRWILFDTDFGFRGNWSFNTLEYALEENGSGKNAPWATLLFRKLVTNIGFRNMFINRYADELNTRFLPNTINTHIDEIYSTIQPEINASYLRWGRSPTLAVKFVNEMKTFANNRPEIVKEHIKSKFNLPAYHQITIINPMISEGSVEVNSNLDIQSNTWVGDYFETVPIQLTAKPKAGFEFSHWSRDISSTDETISLTLTDGFEVTPNFKSTSSNEPIVINEINYKSSDDFDADDWVELYNPNESSINISNWQLKDDNDSNSFTFPEGSTIAAGSYLVIVKKASDFSSVYPEIANFIGDIDFGFGTSDAVRLFDASGALIDEVNYQSETPWSDCADETGNTLELISPDLDNSLPESWNCINSNGSPNAENDSKVTENPTADAGPDFVITLPKNSITLNGSGADPDGGIVSYQWTQVSGNTVILSGSNTKNLVVTNLIEGAYTFELTVTDDEGANGADQVMVTVKPEPSDFALRINTGGAAADYNGQTFIADTYFNAGNTLDRPQTGLPEPYQTFRYSPSQLISYDIPLEDGEYTVNLYFAELWFGATDGGAGGVGSRVFDVTIEGQLAYDNLDIFAEVGANAMLTKSYTVRVIGGVLDIDFDSRDAVGGKRHPVINAIEIRGETSKPDTSSFITTWKTDNEGDSANNQITIPTHPAETYNYNIDWGDGTSDSGVTEDITHSYSSIGTYQVSISGDFPRIFFNAEFANKGDSWKILSVNQWGDIEWTSMESAFKGCRNLDVVATDNPDFSKVFSLESMFYECNNLIGTTALNNWNVGNVQNMRAMFFDALSFNQDIRSWNVARVSNMFSMFDGATSFNQDLGNWDISGISAPSSFQNMLRETAISTVNYDKLLIGWSTLSSNEFRIPTNLILSASNLNYCLGEEARQKLIDDFDWQISDGGKAADCAAPNDFALRINTGGKEADYNGETFITDAYFNTGLSLDRPQTGLPEPYQTFRYSPSQLMRYDIPVPDGEYTVKLYFAELWFGATGGGAGGAGKRIFDITIEGYLAEDNLDIFAEVGSDAMLMKSYSVTVSGGALNIHFDSRDAVGGKRHPVINAIEILRQLSEPEQRPFVTTWKTDNPGVSDSNQIALSTADNETYNYAVKWGDGTSDSRVTGDITHTYATPGTYTVSITGEFPRFHQGNLNSAVTDSQKLIRVNQWGDIKWTSMVRAFVECENLDVVATDVPNLTQVNSMSYMFLGCKSLAGNSAFNDWNVSNVTDMSWLFDEALIFNQDIGDWNVSNVTTMEGMFRGSQAFNHDISAWNVTQVTAMNDMFDKTSISTKNYDALLQSWSRQQLKSRVTFDAGNSQYCLGENARQRLVNDFSWTITDQGKAAECQEINDFALRINTGGASVAYKGETFIGDTYFDTGRTLDRPQTGLKDPFKTFRYSTSQQLRYDIPVPDGEYTVKLYFAELWFGATSGGAGGAGNRVFDVTIEGQLAHDNLDIFAEVGADAMLIKEHTVTVTGGILNIDFDARDAVGGERHPVINAIEILGLGTAVADNSLSYKKPIVSSSVLSPNPAATSTVLSFEKPVELVKIHIFDVTGKLVHTYSGTKVANEGLYVLPVNHLESGVYLIKSIDTTGIPYYKRMVIKK